MEVSPMAEMISVREAAVRWNITERRVATLCKNGRIAGAKKQGNRWLIPTDTQKPADQRLKTGAFRKTERAPKLPLPIGVSNYCLASSEYYYIDKTTVSYPHLDSAGNRTEAAKHMGTAVFRQQLRICLLYTARCV